MALLAWWLRLLLLRRSAGVGLLLLGLRGRLVNLGNARVVDCDEEAPRALCLSDRDIGLDLDGRVRAGKGDCDGLLCEGCRGGNVELEGALKLQGWMAMDGDVGEQCICNI